MAKSSFSGFPDRGRPDGSTTPSPGWELRGHGSAAPSAGAGAPLPPWFSLALVLADGSRVELLAQVREGRVCVEDLRVDPPLPVDGFGALPDWLTGPLHEAWQAVAARYGLPLPAPSAAPPPQGGGAEEAGRDPLPGPQEAAVSGQAPQEPARPDSAGRSGPAPAGHRAGRRRAGGRGDCRRAAAEAYLAAQRAGTDPVLAVMAATGRSRRRSLRLIAAARDKGYLPPRHARR